MRLQTVLIILWQEMLRCSLEIVFRRKAESLLQGALVIAAYNLFAELFLPMDDVGKIMNRNCHSIRNADNQLSASPCFSTFFFYWRLEQG
jgi:hypothetical protein